MESAAGGVFAADLGRPVTVPRFRRARLFYPGLAILMLIAHDWMTLGRFHKATLWGSAFLIASQVLRTFAGGTESWLALARWLVA